MPGPRLRIAEPDWVALRKHCAPSFRGKRDTEYGAIGLLSDRQRAEGREYLVARILWPREGDVIRDRDAALTFSSQYLRRAHLVVRSKGLAGIVTFHTHPHATNSVSFSGFDEEEDPQLVENLQDIWPGTLLSSVVLGEASQMGRVWHGAREVEYFTELVTVGKGLKFLNLSGEPAPAPPKGSEVFDRALALTGTGALATLSRMTVVVIGASGTGSIICELLARAGCRRIILIDHDVVKKVNLNRILHATVADAKKKRVKVDVLKRAIDKIGLGCEVIPIKGSIIDRTVVAKLSEADVIFGCVDRDLPRMILSQYAYQHLVPYIDLGTEIGGDAEGVVSTDARVSYVAPGRPCLRCCGLVTKRRLRFESLLGPERKREIALGYSEDLMISQPAVMDLNMRAASAATMLLRHLLQAYLMEPFPVTLSENLVTYTLRVISSARSADPLCDICGATDAMGFGDRGGVIGLEPEIASQLLID